MKVVFGGYRIKLEIGFFCLVIKFRFWINRLFWNCFKLIFFLIKELFRLYFRLLIKLEYFFVISS